MPKILCVGKFIDPCIRQMHPEGEEGGAAVCDHCHRPRNINGQSLLFDDEFCKEIS